MDQVFRSLEIVEDEPEVGENGNAVQIINPLQLEYTLKVIFSYLNVSSLKNARSVCTLWAELALKPMVTRAFFGVPKSYHANSKRDKEISRNIFESFVSSNEIKIDKMLIRKFKDVSVIRSLQLKILGSESQVKQLKFNFEHSSSYMELMRDLPNLSRVIDWYGKGACYFTEYRHGPANNLQSVLTLEKPLTLSHLLFQPFGCRLSVERNSLEFYEQFLHGLVKTERINIDLNHTIRNYSVALPQVTNQLNMILEGNREELEEMTISSPLRCLTGLEFPELPNLKKLMINICLPEVEAQVFIVLNTCYLREWIFPLNFQFKNDMPNLEEVQLQVHDFSEGNFDKNDALRLWETCFETTGTASSVKRVMYKEAVGFGIDSLRLTFPQAKIIKMKY